VLGNGAKDTSTFLEAEGTGFERGGSSFGADVVDGGVGVEWVDGASA